MTVLCHSEAIAEESIILKGLINNVVNFHYHEIATCIMKLLPEIPQKR